MMTRTIKLLIILLALIMTAGTALPTQAQPGAAPENGQVVVPSGSPVQIAFATCSGFPDYQDHIDAALMAIAQFGPIKGFTVQLNPYLTMCSQATGEDTAMLITDNLQNVAVIGPLYSSSATGALPHFESVGLVTVIHGASQAGLESFGPGVFNRVLVSEPDTSFWLNIANSSPTGLAWRQEFFNAYGRSPDDLAMMAYDAANALLSAIDQTAYLSAGDLLIERGRLTTNVRTTITHPGASGPVTFHANGERINNLQTAVWADKFSTDVLSPRWSWLNPNPAYWSLTAHSGYLRIITHQEDYNQLVQPVPRSNFELRTRVFFEPTENYQMASLYVYGDENNFLKFGRAFCDTPPPDCKNNAIYFDYVKDGIIQGSNFATVITYVNLAYLRLVQDGNTYTAYVSKFATDWVELGSHTIDFDVKDVGLFTGNQGQPAVELHADFDYFIEQHPMSYLYLPMALVEP